MDKKMVCRKLQKMSLRKTRRRNTTHKNNACGNTARFKTIHRDLVHTMYQGRSKNGGKKLNVW